MSINKAILIGNVGRDPDIRYLERENEKKNAVATFTLATTERGYTLANGTQVPERTEWHNIVAWRGLAELAEKYIRKGSQLYIEGKITTRSWEKEGVTRYTTEIVAETIQLLGSRRQENQGEPAGNNGSGKAAQPTAAPGKKPAAEPDMPAAGSSEDDLPF
ncbi:MAG: single-stranded DNA-binding protein [Bacteroidales bacterium]|jgi:single-strand DNA-binding protein|nr:single-stranded DNA-binding protein [Bacteroidales bacterium]